MRTDELDIAIGNELGIERASRQQIPTPRDIAAVLFRQRSKMLVAFLLVAVAVALSGVWVPKYEAHMKILALRQRSDDMVTPSANAPTQFSGDQISEEDLNSEVELLNSEDLLRKVALTAGLAGPAEASSRDANPIRLAKAVRDLRAGLKIEPLRKTNVISISYQTRNPKQGEDVLKALASAYMEKHLEVHHSSREFQFFDAQAQAYKRGLDEAQEKLTSFDRDRGIVSADLQRAAALQQEDAFESKAREARAALLETQKRIDALRAELQSIPPRITTAVRNSDNPQLLEQLKSTLLNLQLKRAELLTKFAPTYRPVLEADRQIADAKSAIAAEESKPIHDETSDQNPDYRWVQGELTKAQADLSTLQARADAAAAIAAKYHGEAELLDRVMPLQQNLAEDAKTQEENYLLYRRKREEARISKALDQGGILNVAIAEQPVVPAIPKRSPLSVAILTLLFAGAVSLSAAFLFDLADPTFRTPNEVAGYLGTPVLAALPKPGV
jgi:uncharacterized protein involved in exopolysaccharide biosynthesis